MGVYIPKMEIPQNCGECPCYFLTEGAWRNECQVLHKEHNQFKDEGRPSWCPLMELPPHGRLIDADAMEKEVCGGCKHGEHKYENCIDCALANAPTITEAENSFFNSLKRGLEQAINGDVREITIIESEDGNGF